jgi:short-subunit dehydrogenase
MMGLRLKDLADQVVVITGASSGIGLCTAKMAAERGARVVLAARSENGLAQAAAEIERDGGAAATVVADVARPEDAQRIAETAIAAFGGIDTWVNNAGVSIYGRLTEIDLEDARRLFDTNFWGVVNGSNAAIPHLREHGGALINIGSMVSEQAIPLQGIYVASKHAVKGYTDTLRLELEEDGAPISVTLVKPAAIDTPFFEHAKNYMESAPKPPAPVYDPTVVARAILECAERPVRDVFVGGGGRMIAGMGTVAPRLTDKYLERSMFDSQKYDYAGEGSDSLYAPADPEGRERGRYEGHVLKSSAYTTAVLHPATTALVVLGVGLVAAAGWRMLSTERDA